MKQTLKLKFPKRILSKRMIAFVFANLLISFSLFAQERVVSGTVKDATGETLIGVNIVIQGTTKGTITDIDGNFSLRVPDNKAVLTVNYIGYKTQEISVGSQKSFNIIMEKDVTGLDEVVVVGYGVQKKKLVTGATVQVKNEDFVKNNVTRIESALQGLTPGMLIVKQSGQPGSDFNITIRGLSSISGNGPLVLIDGVPGSLSMLNPSDIESIDVLKDAASAAIYGSRAANGVVLVTSKKGKSGQAQITYDSYFGFSNLSKKIQLLDAKQYAMIQDEAAANSNKKLLPYSQSYIDGLGQGTNWLDAALNKNAPSQSHYLGITGGNEKSTYSISLSYNGEEGMFNYENKSKFQRLGFRINSEHKLKDYLKIGENLTYTHRTSHGLGTGNQYSNFLHDIYQSCPLIKEYDSQYADGFGRSNPVDANKQNGEDPLLTNPIASMHFHYNGITNNDDVIGDFYAEIKILPGLKFRTDFGGTLNFNTYSDHTDTFYINDNFKQYPKAQYIQSMGRSFNYNFDNVLSYEKEFGKHHIMAMVGMNAQDDAYFNMRSVRQGFLLIPIPVLTNVLPDTTAASYTIQGDFGSGDSRDSYFGRVSYDFNEKYLATVSLRRDGSSRFGKNNRYGYFPSASVGWVISKETFMGSTASWLDFLKIRGSWGQNGKEPADRFVYMAQVGTTSRQYAFGGVEQTGVSPIGVPNPYLKWEASTQTNIGFDSRFLKYFHLSVDYYDKTSKDWIMQFSVPGVTGIAGISTTFPWVNGGNVKNSGYEFDLGFEKSFGDFYLNIGANCAFNKNIVMNVPTKDSIFHGSVSVLYNGSDEFFQVKTGKPMGYFFGYRVAGIFQTQDEVNNYVNADGKPYQKSAVPGDVKRYDENHDGKIDANDKVMLGNPNPDFIFGFKINAEYKGFDFSMNIQGQTGNQIVQSYRNMERFANNFTTAILDRWTGPGTSNTQPRVTQNGESNKNWRNFSSLYIQNGDYAKIKSINIGYDLKKSLFKNTPIEKFRIYVSATNLLTLTKYDGMDPEIGYGSSYDSSGRLVDGYASGIDVGFYPSARTYLFGVNVTF